jgi:hypothetical protein
MSALTFPTTVPASAGLTYAQNVGRAARTLLAALLAIPARAHATPGHGSTARRHTRDDDMALYRLNSLASPYDCVMPNLEQELRVMAGCRD